MVLEARCVSPDPTDVNADPRSSTTPHLRHFTGASSEPRLQALIAHACFARTRSAFGASFASIGEQNATSSMTHCACSCALQCCLRPLEAVDRLHAEKHARRLSAARRTKRQKGTRSTVPRSRFADSLESTYHYALASDMPTSK